MLALLCEHGTDYGKALRPCSFGSALAWLIPSLQLLPSS